MDSALIGGTAHGPVARRVGIVARPILHDGGDEFVGRQVAVTVLV